MFNHSALKRLREEKSWSQWELAVQTQWFDEHGRKRMIRPDQICKYEKGRLEPCSRNIALLARALGVAHERLYSTPGTAPLSDEGIAG